MGLKAYRSGKERARQNVKEGKGISIGGTFGGNKETNFYLLLLILCGVSLDTIDFMSISNVIMPVVNNN